MEQKKPLAGYDLIVAGGGTAGTLAAIAAARCGLHTAVIERNTYLGGMATGSGLSEMNAAGFQGKPIYQGIEKEIFDEMIAKGAAAYHFRVPMSSNKSVLVDRLRYNPEELKLILEEKAAACGVEIYYDVHVESACESPEGCSVEVRSLYQTFRLSARYLIDATGNANLIRMLGLPTRRTPAEEQMICTLMMRLSGLDLAALQEFVAGEGLPAAVKEGYESGILKGKILAFSPIPGTGDASLNVTRAREDYEDVCAFSRGLIETRRQIPQILRFVREKVPGCRNATLSGVAPLLGVRDAERIIGEYELTVGDLESMREFPDTVASGCYPVDIHDPVTGNVLWKMLPGMYHIPYRSLLAKGAERTLTVGKCISTDRGAFGAIRVMPIMMNVGESAGYAVALAAKDNRNVNSVETDELSSFLTSKYQR